MSTTTIKSRQPHDPLRRPLTDAAELDPQGLALIESAGGRSWNWTELDSASAQAAAGLAQLGIGPGDRVATIGLAGVGVAILLHACLRSGAALVPLSARAPAAVLRRQLAVAQPSLVVGEVAPGPDPITPGNHAPTVGFEDLLQAGAAAPAATPFPVRRRTELGLLFTSGTTGEPKPISLTVGNQLASAQGCQASLGSAAGERWLLCLSPHHVGGFSMLVRSAVCHQPLVTVERFSEEAVLAAIEKWQPRLISLVPTMLSRLVEAGAAGQLSRTRAILLGGAPARQEDVVAWSRMGIPVCPSYGLTESNSQIATVPPGRAAELAGTVGYPHPFVRVALVREDGDRLVRVGPGELGLIALAGPVVSPTMPRVRIDGPAGGSRARAEWGLTRDLGRLDPATEALVVHGRADDAILSGGETVYPEEVERVLMAHPLVADAAVRGLPDPRWGQRLEALVVAGPELSIEELASYLRQQLDSAKLPRTIRLVTGLPRSEGGKLQRGRLSEVDGLAGG